MQKRQKQRVKIFGVILTLLLIMVVPHQEVAAKDGYIPQYRMYNTKTGEHLYTTEVSERDSLTESNIWEYEGINCLIPIISDTPMYRLYNEITGFHHYTTSVKERDVCVSRGWIYEGIGWYSGGDTEIYRLYNPKSNLHHYTSSDKERDNLAKNGWEYEGISWNGMTATDQQTPSTTPPTVNSNLAKVINGATQSDADKLNAQFDKIPEKLRNEFISSGWSLYATGENLAKTRYGDEDAIVMGATVTGEKAIYVANDAWFDTIAIHEFAHFIDYQRGWPSRSDEFKQIAKAEMETFAAGIPTYGFVTDESEFFAETFVYLLTDPSKCTKEAARFISQYM